MKSTHSRHTPPRAWVYTLTLVASLSLQIQARPPVPATDGSIEAASTEVPDALNTLRDSTFLTTARIVDAKGRPVIAATWLGEDGYLLTKASEVPRMDQVRVLAEDGHFMTLREIRRDSATDLVLAQVVNGGTPVSVTKLVPSGPVNFGQWLAAPAEDGHRFCVGVLSAQRRKIPGMGAAIGVRMDDRVVSAKFGGVRIVGIAEDSPAAIAGLRADDILLELAGEPIAKYQRVHEIIATRQPGEEIDVRFRRDGREERIKVRLASKTKILANWDGEDFANGGISIRTDNFAQVLQHDLPLGPRDMGAPLFDLEGHLVGINIARVDRVTTFALPTELFWSSLQQWIQTDRHPPKAVALKTSTTAAVAVPEQEPSSAPPSRRVKLHQAR